MSNLVAIENQNQRVLLTSQLAEEYETIPEVISNNFNRNKERYQVGKHFYCLEGEEKRKFVDHHQIDDGCKKAQKLYLWTEKGALLHAKSLGTDKAWEVYDQLVETYFQVKEQKINLENLSPELKMFKSIFDSVARTHLALIDTNERIDSRKDIVTLDTRSWRVDARNLIIRIAHAQGGNEYIREIQAEISILVNQRGGVNLKTRLTNKRRRMADEGVCKSKRDKLNKVDVIAEDKKLIEIYVAIVKEVAVKYGIDKKISVEMGQAHETINNILG